MKDYDAADLALLTVVVTLCICAILATIGWTFR
jgi:hypothetical protein